MSLKVTLLVASVLLLGGISYLYYSQNTPAGPQTQANFRVGFLPVT
jgi:hypothetical protein